MKLISEHLGQIIAALAAVALLICAVVGFKAPIGDFFKGIVDKETSIGDKIVENIDNIDVTDLSSGYLTVSGDAVSMSNVLAQSHKLKVNLSSDTVTNFSNVEVTRWGKNVLSTELKPHTQAVNLDKPIVMKKGSTLTFSYESSTATSWRLAFWINDLDNNPITRAEYEQITDANPTQYLDGTYHGGNNTNILYQVQNRNDKSFTYIANSDFVITKLGFCYGDTNDSTTFVNPMLAINNEDTTYEAYKAPKTVMATATGFVNDLDALSPNTTITTNKSDVKITCKYLSSAAEKKNTP